MGDIHGIIANGMGYGNLAGVQFEYPLDYPSKNWEGQAIKWEVT
jgi:hypothetical protein